MSFDNRTRQLFATDASPYQIIPQAVAFPQTVKQAAAAFQAAAQAGISVTPRGAGTGLAGGALGDGLIVDFARHNREIWEFDKERRTVRVGAGVVLDQLNRFLKPHGFCFGPDVATSSRATLGGMIANDSSGAHAPVYGTTGRHVRELDLVLADGRTVRLGAQSSALQHERNLVEDLLVLNSLQITEHFPPGLAKRWPGYGLARALEQPGNLLPILCGSEGTLAGIFAAELAIVPLPAETGAGLLFFASVAEAMQAAQELHDLQPAAIEHLDRLLFDQTRGQREFQAVRDLLELDTRPCHSILVVEFFDDVKDRLAALKKRRLGLRQLILKTPRERELVWAMRRAGLSLLTSCPGAAKPACFIEDTAVRPEVLPAYVNGLQAILSRAGVEASFYGHAATGLLHVRPVLDLHATEDLAKFRRIADEVAALVAQFKGSLAAEHGVGIARTEYLPGQVGPELYEVMREIKNAFDPHHLLNPGKIIGDGRHRIDRQLRQGAGNPILLPFVPQLAFAGRDQSFVANLEQCNGCGGCLKQTHTMCPTWQATGEEGMSTRGRANLIRAALERRDIADPLRSEELAYALENCLACRACTSECPANVNLPLLKAELLHARSQAAGFNWAQRLIRSADRLGRIGTTLPWLANLVFDSRSVRHLFGKVLGFATERDTPAFARQRFDRWFAKRGAAAGAVRGRVILWDDTFVRYHEPHIGQAAVKVLEAAGFAVSLVKERQCCGRPAFSVGDLDTARKAGAHNLALIAATDAATPIIFLEPSCHSMFAADYAELKLPGAAAVAERCFLFEDFIGQLLEREPGALTFAPKSERLAIHVHCHAKALSQPSAQQSLAAHLPGRDAVLLDTGCCGMAGAFGMMATKYELSVKIAEPLVHLLQHQPYGTIAVLSGTSCRHQVSHLTPIAIKHMAEVLADALA